MSGTTVGVIGLGAMGGGVARSLLRAGFAVRVCALPLTAAAHRMYPAASAHGHGGADDSAVIRMFEALTRIPLPAAGG